MPLVQATTVAIDGRGVLLTGPPGCGKSDLALRLIGRGAVLVADDAVWVGIEHDRLVVGAPGPVERRLHVAGIGLIAVPLSGSVAASLVVSLDPAARPSDRTAMISRAGPFDGYWLPQIVLSAFEASTPDKLLLALDRWGH